MIAKGIERIVKGYGLLLTLAAAGLFMAQIGGFLGGALQFTTTKSPDGAVIEAWIHGGWVVGVCLAICGIGAKLWQPRKARSAAGEDDSGTRRGSRGRSRRKSRVVRRYGRLASAALGGLGGALLGGMLGGSFLLLWFSITYSPFAPREWVSSVSLERQRAASSVRNEPAISTRHPIARIAFGAPLALGAVTGAIMGGVAGVAEEA